jgi:hypothetical protein
MACGIGRAGRAMNTPASPSPLRWAQADRQIQIKKKVMTLFMKKKIVISIVGLLIYNFSFSQQVTRLYLDSLLNISDSNYKQKTDVFFVINGIPYDTNQVDTIISKYDQKYLADAMFLSREKQSYTFYRDVAVVVFAFQQKNKTRRRQWKEAKKLFSDPNKTIPELLIDKKTIANNEASKAFNLIKFRDIMYLDIKQNENGKEVRIWRTE